MHCFLFCLSAFKCRLLVSGGVGSISIGEDDRDEHEDIVDWYEGFTGLGDVSFEGVVANGDKGAGVGVVTMVLSRVVKKVKADGDGDRCGEPQVVKAGGEGSNMDL